MSYALTPEGYDAFWSMFFTAVFVVAATGFAVFALYEGPGLKRGGEPNTASAWFRRHLGISPRTPRRNWAVPLFLLVLYAMAGGLAWFAWHIVAGGPVEAAIWHASGTGDMLCPTSW
jgi:hypothetical protein